MEDERKGVVPGEIVYGLKLDVWGRVGPDLRAELQVNTTQAPNARGLGRPSTQIVRIGIVLCILIIIHLLSM